MTMFQKNFNSSYIAIFLCHQLTFFNDFLHFFQYLSSAKSGNITCGRVRPSLSAGFLLISLYNTHHVLQMKSSAIFSSEIHIVHLIEVTSVFVLMYDDDDVAFFRFVYCCWWPAHIGIPVLNCILRYYIIYTKFVFCVFQQIDPSRFLGNSEKWINRNISFKNLFSCFHSW